jgi:CTP synthase
VPLRLEAAGLGDWLVEELRLTATRDADEGLADWRRFVADIRRQKPVLRIGIVGKYVQLEDAYLSVKESLQHAGLAAGWQVEIEWISSEDLEKGRNLHLLANVDGIVVPGGFGYRGIEGKIVAARYAREHKVPYLGLCLGMQVLCIELARAIFQSDSPNSTEFDISTHYPVIDLMPEQRDIADMGGTMRLGTYPCQLQPGTLAAQLYESQGYGTLIEERHRHRFELNNHYRAEFEAHGLVFSGLSPDKRLVEISELADHPFMIGSQFHPEFKSRPTRPHPMFLGLIQAARTFHYARIETERQAELQAEHAESAEQDLGGQAA